MSDIDDVLVWYRDVLDLHAGFIPDVDAKRAILAECEEWRQVATGPKGNRVNQLIYGEWAKMLATLAKGAANSAPGWNPNWDSQTTWGD